MAIVAMGQVERMIWWKGTETAARETLEMAMLKVKGKEKATRVRFSREVRWVSSRELKPKRRKQPMEVEDVWSVVRSQGKRA